MIPHARWDILEDRLLIPPINCRECLMKHSEECCFLRKRGELFRDFRGSGWGSLCCQQKRICRSSETSVVNFCQRRFAVQQQQRRLSMLSRQSFLERLLATVAFPLSSILSGETHKVWRCRRIIWMNGGGRCTNVHRYRILLSLCCQRGNLVSWLAITAAGAFISVFCCYLSMLASVLLSDREDVRGDRYEPSPSFTVCLEGPSPQRSRDTTAI